MIEDYARRLPAIPWRIVEWLALRIEGSQGRALALAEARQFCTDATLEVEQAENFVIDAVFHRWVISARKVHNSLL